MTNVHQSKLNPLDADATLIIHRLNKKSGIAFDKSGQPLGVVDFPPFADAPMIEGGQGRDADEVTEGAVVFGIVLVAMAALCVGVYVLAGFGIYHLVHA